MPDPKPLDGPLAARSTLVHRMTRTADRLRQLHTRYGSRSQRVFLIWSRFTGEERGEGTEQVIARVELLPTPRVSDLNAITRRPYSAGIFPEGSLRVDEISAGAYTRDMLVGLVIPGEAPRGGCGDSPCGPVHPLDGIAVEAKTALGFPDQNGIERTTNIKTDFWYELMEDGRGDCPPHRQRYRVLGGPSRDENALGWSINLERADEPLDRSGQPQLGPNPSSRDEHSMDLEDGEGPL